MGSAVCSVPWSPDRRGSGCVGQNVLVTQQPQHPATPTPSPASAAGTKPKDIPAPTPAGGQGTDDVAARIAEQIAAELGVKAWQVKAAVDLLDGGSTVPFIARYRKEATGTLDDGQLRELDERLRYLRELEDRRRTVLEAIAAQGKLTPELQAAVVAADTKSRLEDIYLPFKTKRRTKAQIAREAGLEPLADALLQRPDLDPEREAAKYLNAEHAVDDAAAALAGARAILVERVAQDPDLAENLRERLWTQGRMVSRVKKGKETEGQKFADYFEFSQAPSGMPSHRVLALLRGEKDGVLELDLTEADPADDDALAAARTRYESAVARFLGVADRGRPADSWLLQTAQVAWRSRVLARLTADLRGRMFAAAEDEAVRVFAANLRDVLLAAPAGNRATLGLDPGLRTGVKVAVVDKTGKVVATDTVYPHAPARKWDEALATLTRLARQHAVELVAIGNGTASRETDKLAAELIKQLPLRSRRIRDWCRHWRGAAEAGGVRGRCVGVLGLRPRRRRTPRHGRVPARRGVHRPPPAGSAGRVGEDRSEVDRRGAVPARCHRGETGPQPGCRGGGLRERRGRRREHGVAGAAEPGGRRRAAAEREHCGVPERARAVR
ncbi:hypothetical protein ABIE00_003814 [Arthrobacter sp. OAP107]